MGPAVRAVGALLLGYPIVLALVCLVVLAGVIAILKLFVYDPIKAERAKRRAAEIEIIRREVRREVRREMSEETRRGERKKKETRARIAKAKQQRARRQTKRLPK